MQEDGWLTCCYPVCVHGVAGLPSCLCPQRLLTYEPTARITCKEAQEHAFFDDLDKRSFDPV